MISEIKLIELSVQVHGDLVFTKAGGGLQVQHRSGCHRVRETDLASLQAVFGAIEGNLTLENVDTAQQYWFCGCASEPQVGIARQTKRSGLHLQLRCGIDPDVQPDPV